jgi:transposase
MARREELTNEQWAMIKPLIPVPPRRSDGHGRPWRDACEVLNGILWILRSGAQARLARALPALPDLPCRFQQWVRDGTLCQVLEALAADLRERGALDLSEYFIDGTSVVAKKGLGMGTTTRGKGYQAHGGGRPRWFSSSANSHAKSASMARFDCTILGSMWITACGGRPSTC